MKIYRLNRDITVEECDWLDENFYKGTLVYEYRGSTYDCISNKGIAITKYLNTTSFFELPIDALTEVHG